jgi:hypothetical protein
MFKIRLPPNLVAEVFLNDVTTCLNILFTVVLVRQTVIFTHVFCL